MADYNASASSSINQNLSSSSDESDVEITSEEPAVTSLLQKLKAPKQSELCRKRKIQCNPPTGKKKSSGRHGLKEPKVSPSQRVKEFSSEELSISLGRLFCNACRETISVKRSTVLNHVRSVKHGESKAKLNSRQAKDINLVSALKKYDADKNPVGQTLPGDQRLYRVKVVKAFMRAGIPIDILRDILEEKALRLADTRHMLDLIPFILDEERGLIREEIKDKFVSVIFDGTSRLGEVLAIVLCYVEDYKIKQRLVCLEILTKSMTGEEVARELISVLSVTFGIKSHLLLAGMRDGASVNNVAMEVLKVVYPDILNIHCFSHTLDLVGEKFSTPVLSTFSTYWISLFSHSPKTKALWKEQTNKAMASFSKTRWWSRWEIYNQLMLQFGDIEPFLIRNQDLGPALRPKLLNIITDVNSRSYLQMELAAVIDVGEHFIKATYNLEGDGALVLRSYEEIRKVRAVLQAAHYPNMSAIARHLAPGNLPVQQQWMSYGMNCVKDGIEYFNNKFGDDSASPLNAFKAARLFSPSKVNDIQPSAADVDTLTSIPALNKPNMIIELKEELPAYVARAADVSPTIDELEWWQRNEALLPKWSLAAKKVLLLQPSSAAAERVFSLLNASFGSKQANSLEDYLEATIMLQYNKR